ncbi:MAG: superoxide reductase [Brevinematales bacterium]|nr:superoxide reductase [Brevinematales bacterium]
MKIGELIQSADWKTEKHIPAIEAPKSAKKGEKVKVRVVTGAEIAHPNTTAHHIASIEVYFKGNDDKFPYLLGKFEFTAHGASANGADTSTVYTEPDVSLVFKTEKSGTILASSYCNVHGLWENSWDITVE